ncbi:MAG: hypothetical protein Q9182_005191 [Xanthomendoza sp. 2 TL-2023]
MDPILKYGPSDPPMARIKIDNVYTVLVHDSLKSLPRLGLYHTPNPNPQHTLCLSLASLLHTLPTTLFLPFLTAFWTTIISEYTSIPQLRLDKYLLLIRCYISSTFQYLASHDWDKGLIREWRSLMEGDGEPGLAPLSPGNGKVPDGVRYHVLDVWVDEVCKVVEGNGKVGGEVRGQLMGPVRRLEKEGRTKVVKSRARDVLADERLETLVLAEDDGVEVEDEDKDEDEEFEGFED